MMTQKYEITRSKVGFSKEVAEARVCYQTHIRKLVNALELLKVGVYSEDELDLLTLRNKVKKAHEKLRELNHGLF